MPPSPQPSLAELAQTPIQTPIPPDQLSVALSQPPFVYLPDAQALNLRDLGYSALSLTSQAPHAPRLRCFRIFRSGTLSALPVATLSSLPTQLRGCAARVRRVTVFDLRSEAERARVPPPEDGAGLRVVWTPPRREPAQVDVKAFAEADEGRGWGRGVGACVRMYDDVLGAYGAPYRRVFEWLRDVGVDDGEEGAMVFHCTAGKDRTGVLAALILDLVGVPHDAIAADYALSRIGVEPHREMLLAVILKHVRAQDQGVPVDMEDPGFVELCSIRPEVMIAFLQMLKEKYGGAEGFVIGELGFSREDVGKMRANLMESDKA